MRSGWTAVEQRKYGRFRVKSGTLAVPRSILCEPGQIIDISLGGLAFRYIAKEKPAEGVFELDILRPESGVCFAKVPIVVISDFYEIAPETSIFHIPTKRCGVQFGDLTRAQMTQLESFIRSFASP